MGWYIKLDRWMDIVYDIVLAIDGGGEEGVIHRLPLPRGLCHGPRGRQLEAALVQDLPDLARHLQVRVARDGGGVQAGVTRGGAEAGGIRGR